MKKFKEWYFRNGVGILFLGCIIFAFGNISNYLYCTLMDIEMGRSPIGFIILFGMLLICIGAGSVVVILWNYEKHLSESKKNKWS